MSEPHVVAQLLAYVNGNLDEQTAHAVRDHLASCGECRREHGVLKALWADLGRSPEKRPGASLESNFRSMLSSYELGVRESALGKARRRQGGFLERLLAGNPARQLGFATALLLLGLAGGYGISRINGGTQDMLQLRDEVRGLRNLLAVSLLQQESASERLKGVSWSSRLDGDDPGINAALVNAMNHDRNVNVRLAALDALAHDMGKAAVRHEIIRSLPRQSSPMMQLALVDLLVQINSGESREALEQALKRPTLHPDVQKRIRLGIQLFL